MTTSSGGWSASIKARCRPAIVPLHPTAVRFVFRGTVRRGSDLMLIRISAERSHRRSLPSAAVRPVREPRPQHRVDGRETDTKSAGSIHAVAATKQRSGHTRLYPSPLFARSEHSKSGGYPPRGWIVASSPRRYRNPPRTSVRVDALFINAASTHLGSAEGVASETHKEAWHDRNAAE